MLKHYLLITTTLALFAASKPHPLLPDAKLTPGVVDPRVTQRTIKTTICRDGYTATVRNVSTAEKRQVMQRYGLPASELSKVEIDHYLSLEIGGSNDVRNLWPQYYEAASGQKDYLGAREKDVVETHLHREVCAGTMTLDEAQDAIKMWPELYRELKAAK